MHEDELGEERRLKRRSVVAEAIEEEELARAWASQRDVRVTVQ